MLMQNEGGKRGGGRRRDISDVGETNAKKAE